MKVGKKLCTKNVTVNFDDEGNEFLVTRWVCQFPGIKSRSFDGLIHVIVLKKGENNAYIEMIDTEPLVNNEYMSDRIIDAFVRLFNEHDIIIEGCDMLQASIDNDDSDSVEIIGETEGHGGGVIRMDENGIICIDC